MLERRRCQRMQPPYAVIARVHGSRRALVLDLSPHGLLLEADLPLEQHKPCLITLLLATGELRLSAVVRSCRTAIDSGLCLIVAAMAQAGEAAPRGYSSTGSTGSGIGATRSVGKMRPHCAWLTKSPDWLRKRVRPS